MGRVDQAAKVGGADVRVHPHVAQNLRQVRRLNHRTQTGLANRVRRVRFQLPERIDPPGQAVVNHRHRQQQSRIQQHRVEGIGKPDLAHRFRGQNNPQRNRGSRRVRRTQQHHRQHRTCHRQANRQPRLRHQHHHGDPDQRRNRIAHQRAPRLRQRAGGHGKSQHRRRPQRRNHQQRRVRPTRQIWRYGQEHQKRASRQPNARANTRAQHLSRAGATNSGAKRTRNPL